MGPSPQCYIPSRKVIGLLVLEKKIFEGFLLYMSVAAILIMWPRPCEQTFVHPSHLGSVWNLALIGQAVLEKEVFENGVRRTDDGRRRTDDGPWLYYKHINEPEDSGELIMFDRYYCIKTFCDTRNSILIKKILWKVLIFGDWISAKKARSLHVFWLHFFQGINNVTFDVTD